jgi:hypothetical protein
MKRLVLVGSALTLGAATGLGIRLVTAGGAPPRSGRATVTRATRAAAGPVVRGRILVPAGAARRRLALPASAPLVGNLGPVAAPSPDGRSVAYNTWRWHRPIDWEQPLAAQGIATGDALGTPQLRVLDMADGTESALEPGSLSPAWRHDGALAYARGVHATYRANEPYLRVVVVRRTPGADPAVWLGQPDRYTVQAWAGHTLVVRRDVPGGNADILAVDGPGSARPLATQVDLLAVSPDGSEALVAENVAETTSPAVRLVQVRDGREIARMPIASIVDPAAAASISWVNGPGDWRGDHVVVSSSTGLVVLRIRSGSIALEQVIHVDSATRPNGAFYEPRFTDEGAHTIVTWADLPATGGRQSAQFVCDRYALTCDEGAAVPADAAPRPVYDESGGDR